MKKLSLLLILSAGLSSCVEILVEERTVFAGKIEPRIYYDYAKVISVLPDGIIYAYQKSYTNGDSTQCELYSKQEYIVAKVDFEGNELWHFIRTPVYGEIYHPNGHFYSIDSDNSGDYRFKKYSNQLFLQDDLALNLKRYVPMPYVKSIKILPNGKFWVYGNTLIESKAGAFTYQFFWAEISENGVIEKIVTDPNTYTTSNQVSADWGFSKNANGNTVGLLYEYDYTKKTLGVSRRVYDHNYNLIKIENKNYANENSSPQLFQHEETIHLLASLSNGGTKIITPTEVEISEREVPETLNWGIVNNKIRSDKGYYFLKQHEIVEVLPDFTIRKVTSNPESIYLHANDIFWDTEKKKLVGVIQHNSPRINISFIEQVGDKVSFKNLHASEYSRRCFRFD